MMRVRRLRGGVKDVLRAGRPRVPLPPGAVRTTAGRDRRSEAMDCGNCGADIPATLRFCTTCGAPTDNEETRLATEETRVAEPRPPVERADRTAPRRQLQRTAPEMPARAGAQRAPQADDDEHVIFTVRPTFLFIGVGYAL